MRSGSERGGIDPEGLSGVDQDHDTSSSTFLSSFHHFSDSREGDAGKTRGGHTPPNLIVVARASGQTFQWGATVRDGGAERIETKDENKNRYVAY